MAYIGNTPAEKYISLSTQHFSVSATASYTLTSSVTNEDEIALFINNVRQEPGSSYAYTATGTALTLSAATAGTDTMYCVYLGKARETVTPPADSVDGTKITDNAINSEHYVDGSIDLVHLQTGTDGELITWDASGDPAAVAVGAATHVLTSNGAGAAPTFQAASGGDGRNFIIDGGMTQSPEGNKTANAHGAYTAAALWELNETGGDVVVDTKLTADAPTIAESGYSGTNCLHVDVTTAESAVGAAESLGVQYFMTGSDFAHLHQQQITISFWHKHTKTGIYCVAFANNAFDRHYIFEYTQSSTNTWEKHTETVTMDSSGTWLLTEADIGLKLYFTIFAGSDRHATADTWAAGADWATSSQVAGADSTSNDFKITQVMLTLGSSAPTAFLGEPISTVRDQVLYYVEMLPGDVGDTTNSGFFANGHCDSANVLRAMIIYRPKRVVPSLSSVSATTGDYSVRTAGAADAVTQVPEYSTTMKSNSRANFTSTGNFTAGQGGYGYASAETGLILIDARH